MSFQFKKAEFIDRKSLLNYPINAVCSLLKLDKPNFPGRTIRPIGAAVQFLEKIAYRLKKIFADVQSRIHYGVSRKSLKLDLCKKLLFKLKYTGENAIDPKLNAAGSLRLAFNQAIMNMKLVVNAHKEIEGIESTFGFMMKSKKADLNVVRVETKQAVEQKIKSLVEDVCQIIEQSANDDLVYIKEVLERPYKPILFSAADQDRLNASYIKALLHAAMLQSK